MVILRAAWRAVRSYAPLLATRVARATTAVSVLIGTAAGGATAALSESHPARIALIAVGCGILIGSQAFLFVAARAVRMPEGSGPVWDRDDELLKAFGQAGTTRPVPTEQREDLARWAEAAALQNVPLALAGLAAIPGLIALVAGCVGSDVGLWVATPLIAGVTATLGIPAFISAGRGQLAFERAMSA